MTGRSLRKIIVLAGTRPEVIKLAPVVRALRAEPANFLVRLCSTGQHRAMVQQVLTAFGLALDVELDAMTSAKSLGHLTARLFHDLDDLFEQEAPDCILVQGDTTSAMVAAVCAYYRRIMIGHVEAGLRTHNRWSPFPEEINRTFIGHVAELHFAPTERAAANLLHAGVPKAAIHVTGNTVIDALLWVSDQTRETIPADIDAEVRRAIEGRRLILVTSHRRESFGEGLANICGALKMIVDHHPDTVVVYPVHLNPNVREPVHRLLKGHDRILLREPFGYVELVWLMQRSFCILTDSGGIQEEAPTLGKPLLIMRDLTERPEVVEAGAARIVGTDVDRIVGAARELFERPDVYERMARVANPFGDGRAALRIAEILSSFDFEA